MESLNVSQIKRKGKKDIIYCRMDAVMINQLFELREKSGISTSELLRESVRRFLDEVNVMGEVSLTV